MGLDTDGYPLEESLENLKSWDYFNRSLADFLKLWNDTWWSPSWGWRFTRRRLYVSTGGWSGNEETIDYIYRNFLFWSLHWVSTRRGGHYTFELPAKVIKEARSLGCVEQGVE